MDFIYITNDPVRARAADGAGVDRVMVDLEIHGKVARQGHRNTVISRHTPEDVSVIRRVLRTARLMVRVNPMHAALAAEVDDAVDRGADILMLPMFTSAGDVREFVRMVGGRARVCLLLETGAALARADDVASVSGVDEIHIGLNDLHLALGLDFMFELLSGGLVDHLASILRARRVKFGFGGVGRLESGPLRSNWILSEHCRLGSSMVILSRDFNRVFEDVSEEDGMRGFRGEVSRVRGFVDGLASAPPVELAANAERLRTAVRAIAADLREGAPSGTGDSGTASAASLPMGVRYAGAP